MFSTIDETILVNLNKLTIGSPVWLGFAYFGAVILIYILFAIPLALLVTERHTRIRLLEERVITQAVLAIILATAIGFFLAIAFHRNRPPQDLSSIKNVLGYLPANSSFPSAHAWISFALAGTFIFHRQWRTIGTLMILLASVIAVSRVMVGVHYPSDVLAGALLGIISAYVVVYISPKLFHWLDIGTWRAYLTGKE